MDNNLRIDEKRMNDSDIVRHKDFDTLFRSYRMIHVPVYRKAWFIGTSVAAAAVIAFLLLYFGIFRNQPGFLKNDAENHQLTYQDLVIPDVATPPLIAFEPKAEKFDVNAGGGTINTQSGAQISIPANVFVDKNGNPVTGPVEVRFREFHNPVEFFLSGIPMGFRKDDKMYQFESDGVFEILAFAGDEPVFMDGDQAISIEMNSYFPGEFETYAYQTEKKKWFHAGTHELLAMNSDYAIRHDESQEAEDSLILPVMPRKADRKKDVLNLVVDLSKFPELTPYKGVLFEVNDQWKKYDQKLNGVAWQDASLKPSEKAGQYYLTLVGRDSSVTFAVYPVFSNKDYELAMAVYNEKKMLAEEHFRDRIKQNTPFNASSGNDNRMAEALQKLDRVDYAALLPSGRRKIEVTDLGIYQAGIPREIPTSPIIRPYITDLQGNAIEVATFFLADRNRNILYSFDGAGAVAYTPNAPLLFWIVTKDGNMGVLSPESFLAMVNGKSEPVLPMNITDAGTGVEILRSYMAI